MFIPVPTDPDRETANVMHACQCHNDSENYQVLNCHTRINDTVAKTYSTDSDSQIPTSLSSLNRGQRMHNSVTQCELQEAEHSAQVSSRRTLSTCEKGTQVPASINEYVCKQVLIPNCDSSVKWVRLSSTQNCVNTCHIACQTSANIAEVVQTGQHLADDDHSGCCAGLDETWSVQTMPEDKQYKSPASQIYSNVNGRSAKCYQSDTLQEEYCTTKTENILPCNSPLACIDLPYISTVDLKVIKDASGSEIEVGNGRFGRVCLGTMKGKREPVALKQILKASSLQAGLQEARILKYLEDTDAVPRLHGVVCDEKSEMVTIVQDYFGDGFTLFDLLSSVSRLPDMLSWMSLAYQIVKGLQVIHDKDVLLNDIKINNVLVDMHKLRLKYIDVGLATVGNGRKFKHKLPTDDRLRYLAPEVRMGQASSDKSDIYSMCYMLFQLSMVIKDRKLIAIAYRGAAVKPGDRPSLKQLKSNVGRLLFEY